jgi:hypothetical protein
LVLGFDSDKAIVKAALVDLLAVYPDLRWSINADPDPVPLDQNHLDVNTSVDHNPFPHAAREN